MWPLIMPNMSNSEEMAQHQSAETFTAIRRNIEKNRRGKSQEALAARAGIAQKTVSNLVSPKAGGSRTVQNVVKVG